MIWVFASFSTNCLSWPGPHLHHWFETSLLPYTTAGSTHEIHVYNRRHELMQQNFVLSCAVIVGTLLILTLASTWCQLSESVRTSAALVNCKNLLKGHVVKQLSTF